MTLSEAQKIKQDWDGNQFNGRPKTMQVLKAEKVILESISTPITENKRLEQKLKLQSQKVGNLIKEIELDPDWNDDEKLYLTTIANQLKSFYDRYKKRNKVEWGL